MNLKELKDYKNWVGKTPKQIIETVQNVGGWSVVFPNWLPLWAHRIRNYFNREPQGLRLLSKQEGAKHLRPIDKRLDTLKNARYDNWYDWISISNLIDTVAENNGLSGDVYLDQLKMIWFQMTPGSTIYHWGRDPIAPIVESPWQQAKGQEDLPVFKLVAPDGTGGSRETILKNAKATSKVVQKEGEMLPIANLINTENKHQGSYNYSETIVKGIAAHEKRDVKPHAIFRGTNIYLNPRDRFSPLSERIFPEYAPNETEPLAKQIGEEPSLPAVVWGEAPATARE